MSASLLARKSTARQFLAGQDSLRESLFKMASEAKPGPGDTAALEAVSRIVRECELPESDVRLAEAMLAIVRSGRPPNPEDLARVDSVLDECGRILQDFLSSQQPMDVEIRDSWLSKFSAYSDLLTQTIPQGRSPSDLKSREHNIQEVEKAVFRSPGKFILMLYEELNSQRPRAGFSYGSVRLYVDELVRRGRILTVGGPQGIPRYCFPHPNVVQARKRYYGGPFGIEAIIEENVSEAFNFSRQRGPFVDVYRTNKILQDPVFLVTGRRQLDKLQNRKVKSYGKLLQFSGLKDRFGLVPRVETYEKHDVLLAGRVAIEGAEGKEMAVWSDPKLENLHPERRELVE